MLHKIVQKIVGDLNEKELKRLEPKVQEINQIEEKLQKLSEKEFKSKTTEFKERIQAGEDVDDLLAEAFAVVKNACRRLSGTKYSLTGSEKEWNMVPYDVQLLGGMVLHEGNIAEMKTGEGKTLVCTLPAYLNALTGKGVHIITVNDYLAKRDAEWMGLLFNYLGLEVGCIYHGLNSQERRTAYDKDITYGTNNEFGFDYLRDNMAQDAKDLVMRDLHYAIVDEVDSILIDEARTPLIISAPAEESTSKYYKYAQLIPQLTENEHFNVDEKLKSATLTEEGIKKMESMLNIDNIYSEAGFSEVHHIEQALKAYTLFKKDIDYILKDGEIVIVDEFTGRLMPGRRYSEGLHQAIEAKENVEVKRESKTLATITFQNYFRMYEKLSGMTGTAFTEAEEFRNIYGLDVIVVPTNKPMVRDDRPDRIYKTEKGKFKAIAQTIQEKHAKNQPVLVGTISIEKSEAISEHLKKEKIPHNVLNAKHHEREAEIVAKAGQPGAVTIATNMAGRGTDIVLGDGVKEVGGLCIIGSERHESRRIDNQLRGRSGRQGDPGESTFYISLQDDLMRLFGSERLKGMLDRLGVEETEAIENKMISRSIESAQKRVEGNNFDIRKHVLQYDDVMNKQREVIYTVRRDVLTSDDNKEKVLQLFDQEIRDQVYAHQAQNSGEIDVQELQEIVSSIVPTERDLFESFNEDEKQDAEKIIEQLTEYIYEAYEQKEKEAPSPEIMRKLEKAVYLRAIDNLWVEHLTFMTHLREGVALRGYGQRNPVQEYKQEGYIAFEKLMKSIQSSVVNTVFKVRIISNEEALLRGKNMEGQDNANQLENLKGGAIAKHQQQLKQAEKVQKVGIKTVGRNDPCPCGSGKKYKKCCGKTV